MNEFGDIEIKTHGDSSESPAKIYGAASRGSDQEGEQKVETEDQYFILTDKKGEGSGNAKTFGVFDGAGGVRNGRAAAKAAQQTVMEEIRRNPDLTNPDEVKRFLESSMYKAHDAAKETGGMTTGSVGYIVENPTTKKRTLVIAHVGDSAIFIERNGKVEQITKNDDLEDVGRGNVLTQGLGHGEIRPHLYDIDLMEGDRILAATDGVTDGISKEQIKEILSKNSQPENALEELISAGQAEYYKKGGMTDDATAILIDFKSVGNKSSGITQPDSDKGENAKDEDEIFSPGTMVKVRRSDGRLQDHWFVSGKDKDGNILVSSPRGEHKKVNPKSLREHNPPISGVENVNDLYYAINQLPGDFVMTRSGHELSKEEITSLINQVITGTKELKFITRRHGLRQKVKDLMEKKERGRRSANQEKGQLLN